MSTATPELTMIDQLSAGVRDAVAGGRALESCLAPGRLVDASRPPHDQRAWVTDAKIDRRTRVVISWFDSVCVSIPVVQIGLQSVQSPLTINTAAP